MTEALNAVQWLASAEEALAAALLMQSRLPGLAATTAFQAQQCAERALKALLIHLEADVPRTHDLGKLLKAVRAAGCDPAPELAAVAALTSYAVELRYAAVETVSAEEARTAVRLANLTLDWARTQVAEHRTE